MQKCITVTLRQAHACACARTQMYEVLQTQDARVSTADWLPDNVGLRDLLQHVLLPEYPDLVILRPDEHLLLGIVVNVTERKRGHVVSRDLRGHAFILQKHVVPVVHIKHSRNPGQGGIRLPRFNFVIFEIRQRFIEISQN